MPMNEFIFQSHVHKYNVVSDLSGYKSTTPKVTDTGKDHGVFVMDTESVGTPDVFMSNNI